MRVSIITINYNNFVGLQRTMQSVFSQTCHDYEYIVIDGGSTDGSREEIERCKDRIDYWVSEPDKGIYNAMNKGIAVARGEFCLFVNSGDTLHAPDVLEQVVPLLKDKDFYVGDMQQTGERHHLIRAPRRVTASYLAYKYLAHQSAFIRTEILKASPYDERYRIESDWGEMFHELIIRGRSYQRIDIVVSDFEIGGISSQEGFHRLKKQEHREILESLLPVAVVDDLLGKSKFEKHVIRALTKESALSRDLKILRNVLKALPRDLWRAVVKPSE